MFENIANFFKKLMKTESKNVPSKETAKERLHLVLMQDRANVSADFLELMKQEIIEVIKKYIDVEESAIDVRLTKEVREDGTQGAPSLYANIPILKIKNDVKKEIERQEEIKKVEDKKVEENKEPNENKETEVKEEKEEVKEEEPKQEENNENENKEEEKQEESKDEENKEADNKEEQKEETKKEEIDNNKEEENNN